MLSLEYLPSGECLSIPLHVLTPPMSAAIQRFRHADYPPDQCFGRDPKTSPYDYAVLAPYLQLLTLIATGKGQSPDEDRIVNAIVPGKARDAFIIQFNPHTTMIREIVNELEPIAAKKRRRHLCEVEEDFTGLYPLPSLYIHTEERVIVIALRRLSPSLRGMLRRVAQSDKAIDYYTHTEWRNIPVPTVCGYNGVVCYRGVHHSMSDLSDYLHLINLLTETTPPSTDIEHDLLDYRRFMDKENIAPDPRNITIHFDPHNEVKQIIESYNVEEGHRKRRERLRKSTVGYVKARLRKEEEAKKPKKEVVKVDFYDDDYRYVKQ